MMLCFSNARRKRICQELRSVVTQGPRVVNNMSEGTIFLAYLRSAVKAWREGRCRIQMIVEMWGDLTIMVEFLENIH